MGLNRPDPPASQPETGSPPRDRSRVQAITFDVGGTLIEPWPSVGHVYARVAAEFGLHGLAADDLNARFLSAWQAHGGRAESKADWAAIVQSTLAGLAPLRDAEGYFEALYGRFGEAACWHVYEDVRPTLEALQSRRIRLGLCSNWDDRLRPLLDRLDLTRFFEVIVISCEVGCRKPEAGIFLRAARQFDLAPASVLHVGDSLEFDVEGATGAGLRALGVRRGRPGPEVNGIPSLTALLERL